MKTCWVLQEEPCLLAEDSLKHLSVHTAVHVAHGDVVDSVAGKLQHCTRELERKKEGQIGVLLPEMESGPRRSLGTLGVPYDPNPHTWLW